MRRLAIAVLLISTIDFAGAQTPSRYAIIGERLLKLRRLLRTYWERSTLDHAASFAQGVRNEFAESCLEQPALVLAVPENAFPNATTQDAIELRKLIDPLLKELGVPCPKEAQPRSFSERASQTPSAGGDARWAPVDNMVRNIYSLAADPSTRTFLAGTNRGLYISRDGGVVWNVTGKNSQMSGLDSQEFYSVAASGGLALAGGIGSGSYSALYGAVLDAQSEPKWSRERLDAKQVYALALGRDAVYVSTDRGLFVAGTSSQGDRRGRTGYYREFPAPFGTIAAAGLDNPIAAAGYLWPIASDDFSRGSFRRSNPEQWVQIGDGMELLADGKPPRVTALAANAATLLAGTENGHVYQFCWSSGAVQGADAWRDLPFRRPHTQRISALAIGPSAIYAADVYDVYSLPLPVCGKVPAGALEPMTGDLMRFGVRSLAVYGDSLFAGTNAGAKCGLHRTPIVTQASKATAVPSTIKPFR